MQKYLLIFVLTLGFTLHLHAQDQRFVAAAVVGFNASQIDGDRAAGYEKPGIVLGIRGGANLIEKMSLTFDILYSQRGSKRVPRGEEIFEPYGINTPYVELPFQFHYKDWLVAFDDGSEYYRVSIEAGPVVSYLLKPTVTNLVYESEIDNFNKIDLGITGGVSYYFGEHLGFSARFLKSITPLYNNQKHKKNFESLRGYNFNFSLIYSL